MALAFAVLISGCGFKGKIARPKGDTALTKPTIVSQEIQEFSATVAHIVVTGPCIVGVDSLSIVQGALDPVIVPIQTSASTPTGDGNYTASCVSNLMTVRYVVPNPNVARNIDFEIQAVLGTKISTPVEFTVNYARPAIPKPVVTTNSGQPVTTNASTFTLNGACYQDKIEALEARLDGGAWSQAIATCASGLWSYNFTGLDGTPPVTHTFEIRSYNSSSVHTYSDITTFTLNIDQELPTTSPVIAGVRGGADTVLDAWLGAVYPIVHWATDANAETYEITIRSGDNSTELCAPVSVPKTDLQFEFKIDHCPAPLVNGQNYIARIWTVDLAGNKSSAPNSFTFTVDQTAPTTNITAQPTNPTKDLNSSFSFTVNPGVTAPTATIKCKIDSGAANDCVSPFATGALALGTHTFTLTATDVAGNVATASYTWDIEADLAAPICAITTAPPLWSNDPDVNFVFNCTDDDEVDAVECKLDAGSWAACDTTTTHTWLAPAEGNRRFELRALDRGGNYSTIVGADFGIDRTGPILTLTVTPPNPSSLTQASFSFTAVDSLSGVANPQCRTDLDPFANCVSPWATPVLAPGPHGMTLQALDNAGNLTTLSTYTWTIDTTAPNAPILPADADVGPNHNWTWASGGGGGNGTYRYKLDDTDLTVGATETTSLNWATTPDMTFGSHTLYVQERDAAGNWSASGDQTVQVKCSAGSYLTGVTCTLCAPGSYTTIPNLSVSCSLAGTGEYISATGATSAAACTNKPANATAVTYSASSGLTTNTCPIASADACDLNYVPNGTSCRLLCGAGQYWDGAACLDVGLGYYSPIHDDARYACPASSQTSSTTSDAANDCLADAGFYNCEDGTCDAVGIGYYSGALDNVRYACPSNSTTLGTNSASVASCLGAAGYYNCEDGTCEPVGIGYYSPANDNARYACALHRSTATTTSSSVNDCAADAGYYGADTTIAAIDVGPGYYSPALDNTRYQCDAGSYCATNNNIAGTGDGLCATGYYCPVGSIDDHGAPTGGACPAGYSCPPGTGSISPLNVCGADTYSSGTAGSCASCPVNSRTVGVTAADHDSINDCYGEAGYYNCQSGTCSQAGAGYYSPTSDNSRYQCAAGQYGSSNNNFASACDGACSGGYYCPTGSISDQGAGLCNDGTYSAGGASAATCNACPANSNTLAGGAATRDNANDCLASAGFYNCEDGTCDNVGIGFYSVGNTNSRVACPTNSTTVGTNSTAAADCVADAGYYNCEDGACDPAGIGFYSPAGDNNRYACPANRSTAGPTSSMQSQCLAVAGYYGADTSIAAISVGAGYYSPALDNSRYLCDAGSYCATNNNAAATGDGLCAAGYYCPTGSMSDQGLPLGGACPAGHACPAGTAAYTAATICTADSYSLGTVGSCTVCPTRGHTTGTTAVDHDQLADCRAEAGYYDCQSGVCKVADVGYYSPADDNSRYQCAAGSFGSSTTNASATCDGACDPGYYCPLGSGNGQGAGICNDNTYSTGGATVATCTSCPVNSATAVGGAGTRDEASDCLGNAGYYSCEDGSCNDAGIGYYSPTQSNSRTACPVNSTTVGTNSSSIAQCVADAGYYNCEDGTCDLVGIGYYSPVNDNARYACPAFTETTGSGTGADALTDCLAVTDYWNADADSSTAAVAVGNGFYSPYRNDSRTVCTNLPSNATSVSYSGSGNGANNCPIGTVFTCDVGYTPNGDHCLDHTPNAITFTDQTGVEPNLGVMSNAVVVNGFDGPLTATCSGACYMIRVNGVGLGTTANNVMPGDSIVLLANPSTDFADAVTASMTLGFTTSATWTITTRAGYDCTGTPWGTLAHEDTRTGYSSATPGPPTTCADIDEVRTCNDGVLSGSFTSTSCAEGCAATPWGNVASGFSDTAYSTASPTGTCASVSETRTCTNGSLSGSYTNTSCLSGCTLPWGGTLTSGQSATGYSTASPSAACSTVAETRTCTNGSLSGSYTLGSCNDGCTGTPWGAVAHGYANTAFQNAASASCAAESEVRTCSSGTLSGSYTNVGCTDGTPDPIAFTNQTGVALSSTISSNAVTVNDFTGTLTATCSGCTHIARNGSWTAGTSLGGFSAGDTIALRVTSSGSFVTGVNATVTLGATTSSTWSVTTRAANGCSGTPWGSVAHGYSNTAYSTGTPTAPTACSAVAETRTCTDGTMSGSYTATSCAEGCSTPWGNVAHGYSNTAYSTSSPIAACSSVSETRTCTNGTLSGSFTNTSCLSGCTGTPWGAVASGYSNTAYSTASPTAACSTVSQTRTCTNGTLSGSFASASCNDGCTSTPWGNVAHGFSSTAYSAAANPNCASISQTRTCSAGSMSGSYTNTSCTDNAPNSFSFIDVIFAELSTATSATAVTVSGFDGPLTATCSGCTHIARNGSWTAGTSLAGFMAGDTIAIRATSSSSYSTGVTATATIGMTTSSTWTVSTRAAAACAGTPWGTVAHGYSNTAYSTGTPTPSATCSSVSQTRTCTDGTMSGSFTVTSCNEGCSSTPWGNVAHGYSNTAYSASAHANCASISQTRTCSSGSMSGSFTNTTCTDDTPNAFSFSNQSGVNPSTPVASNAVTVAGFDGPLTATCTGCTAIARNGSWGGTSVGGFMAGDTIAIRVASSGSFSTAVNASATLGGTTSSTWSVTTRAANNCTGTPWGTVNHGNSVTGYSTATPTGGTSCASVSQTRTCTDGTLSGSYANTSCSEGCTSTPWGNVASGYSNTAYSSATPASTCAAASQTRTCTNGTMSGSYTATSCTAGCTGTPWGAVSHGYSNTAYSSATPASSCASAAETRTCSSGTMSGSYTATGCTNGCTGTPWGSVAHGYSSTAYSTNLPTAACSTVAQTRTCSNGSMSGSYANTSCNDGCSSSPWGAVAHGYSNTAYSTNLPAATCASVSQTRTCSNGSLSGSYANTSCTNGCTGTPWGAVAHGYSATAYSTNLPAAACSSVAETRTCSNGSMNGSYANTSCTSGCTGTPWGAVSHGYSNTAYSSAAPPGACASYAETRTCSAGSMNGSYSNTSCTSGCTGTPWGNVSHGYSNTAYSTNLPAAACSSVAQTRTCSAGSMSGSYTATGCNDGCPSTPWGAVAHGYSNTAYSSTAPPGACASYAETRTCSNGSISGSYANTSCTSGCTGTPWGNVSHGYSNTAYSSTTPAAACSSVQETRTCSAGSMSGSYANTSCTSGCTGTPWGSVSHGYSNTAYSSTAPPGACASYAETRTCSAGSMSGSYGNTSCTSGCTGTPWGSVSHGYSNTAYSITSGNCAGNSQTRTCSAGSMSGTYPHASCTPASYTWQHYSTESCVDLYSGPCSPGTNCPQNNPTGLSCSTYLDSCVTRTAPSETWYVCQ